MSTLYSSTGTIPLKYLPKRLTRKDRKQQHQQLLLSRKAYRKGRYVSRRAVSSYPHRPSRHLFVRARVRIIRQVLVRIKPLNLGE